MERIAGGVLHSVTWAMLEMRCASLFFPIFLIAGRVRDRRREEGAANTTMFMKRRAMIKCHELYPTLLVFISSSQKALQTSLNRLPLLPRPASSPQS